MQIDGWERKEKVGISMTAIKGINLVTEANSCRSAGWHQSGIYSISGVVDRKFTLAGRA